MSSGDGSIYRAPEGGWIAAIDLPAKAGRRRQRRKRRARTKADARKLLREMRKEVERSGSVSSGTRRLTETAASYRAVRLPAAKARSTKDGVIWMAKLIDEGLGGIRIDQLTVAECDDFLARCAVGLEKSDGSHRRPIAPVHLPRVRTFLVKAIPNDMRLGYVGQNVAELSELPEAIAEEATRRALSVGELSALHARSTGAVGVLIDLSGRHGLRPSEARALRWWNLNFDRSELTITNQLDEDDEFVPPKTSEAPRTRAIDPVTAERPPTRRERQARLQARATSWSERDLVATTRTGTAIHRKNYLRSMRNLCTKLEIDPIVPYELRHTAISHQAELGRYTSWELADWAGTSERMISTRYRHKLRKVIHLRPVDLTPTDP